MGKQILSKKEYDRQRYLKMKERIKLSNLSWREKNKERYAKYDLEYRTKNKEKIRLRSLKWARENRERFIQYNKDWRANLRTKVIKFLGGYCTQCGFADVRALQIDHINGGGREDRKGLSPKQFYEKVMEDKSNKYQLLCANCNSIKRIENKEFGKRHKNL